MFLISVLVRGEQLPKVEMLNVRLPHVFCFPINVSGYALLWVSFSSSPQVLHQHLSLLEQVPWAIRASLCHPHSQN